MVASCKIGGGLRNLDCKILIVYKLYIKHKKLIYIYIYMLKVYIFINFQVILVRKILNFIWKYLKKYGGIINWNHIWKKKNKRNKHNL
jgi:hypothetical protein